MICISYLRHWKTNGNFRNNSHLFLFQITCDLNTKHVKGYIIISEHVFNSYHGCFTFVTYKTTPTHTMFTVNRYEAYWGVKFCLKKVSYSEKDLFSTPLWCTLPRYRDRNEESAHERITYENMWSKETK